MLPVAAAREQILDHCQALAPELLPVSPAALGRIVAETVVSDLDMPPFDKAMMDGYAVRSADLPEGRGRLLVIEEITAGNVPRHRVEAGQASRIMTGAPLPEGADVVVVIERTTLLDERHVAIDDRPPRPGQHIQPRGREMARGEVVVRPGDVLRPQECGVLAMVGRATVRQVPPPRVAVLATGDELVEVTLGPGPGQIRNSNATMLLAQVACAGGVPHDLGIARDSLDSLSPRIEEGLRTCEVLVLSGGVSAGKFDLVPEALRNAGVTAHFHKVALKPGKPLLFGTAERHGGKRLVFGLPGNPVSSFVCFELFLRPALRCLAGRRDLDLPAVTAVLTEGFRHTADRPTYHPARLQAVGTGWQVTPVRWLGSADLRAFLSANALLVLPPGDEPYPAGAAVEVLALEGAPA